jgi:hypothetical protein
MKILYCSEFPEACRRRGLRLFRMGPLLQKPYLRKDRYETVCVALEESNYTGPINLVLRD